jgi:hypothetical protein
MAKAKEETASEFLRRIGKKGGQVNVPKGVAVLTKKERKERAKKAAEARWGKKSEGS